MVKVEYFLIIKIKIIFFLKTRCGAVRNLYFFLGEKSMKFD